MSTAVATALQVLGALIAPLAPGFTQTVKARLQGRRGPSPLQPYRTLRRLWHKSPVAPESAGVLYRFAPPLTAACALLAIAIVPVAGRGADLGVGHDALALIGILALTRFTLAASAWDTGNGFSLMGAARDLTVAVFAEALLALTLLSAALPAHSSDLRSMTLAASGTPVWGQVAHWCGAAAFVLVVLVETGRQPIDNPDTHLELTMIHEGPLLEYAGRDLALLQWSAHVRHWLVLLLGAELFLPHPVGFAGALAALALALLAQCSGLAVIETAQAKMRTLRVPALLGLGCLVAFVGIGTFVAGAAT